MLNPIFESVLPLYPHLTPPTFTLPLLPGSPVSGIFSISPMLSANLLNSIENKNAEADAAECTPTISDIFKRYGNEFREHHSVPSHHLKVMRAIENCRTGAYGFHISVCDHCGHTETFANSCRDRHCPMCQGNKREEWVAKRIDELLPVPYFHVVFTLHEAFYPMCLYNQEVIYDLLFEASSKTLQEFGSDAKWLGGKTGFFGVLHTWGQQMAVHLHVHYVMPACGIDEDGKWVFPSEKTKEKFLFPVQALSKVYRGKFIEGLKAAYQRGALQFPGAIQDMGTVKGFRRWINTLYSSSWVVYTKAPYGSPEAMVRYVGRYTHQVAISNSRILSMDDGVIRFRFKNYRKADRIETYEELWEEMELPAAEFIRRFLFHVLPKRYHRIRHFGFLGNGQRSRMPELWETPVVQAPEKSKGASCPKCQSGRLIPIVVIDGYNRIVKGSFSELNEYKRLVTLPVAAKPHL